MRKSLSILMLAVLVSMGLLSACTVREQTAADRQRDAQEKMNQQGTDTVGLPNITKFREAKMLKMIQERCDKGVVTYSYLENVVPKIVVGHTALGGKLTYVSESVSYPIPYASQLTAPESMQRYYVKQSGGVAEHYGVTRLPQPEPNGIHKPATAEATYVMMKDPSSDAVEPVYSEPKLMVFAFKLPMDK